MASGPIISWQINRQKMETVRDFIFLGFKITVDDSCSHEIKMLASWKKSYDQPRQHIKKQRHYFANKSPSSKTYGFSSSHAHAWHECESWTRKKSVRQRIDAFELWCWRRLLRVPWTARRLNQSIQRGNQPWMSIGRTDAKVETPILWPPDAKS